MKKIFILSLVFLLCINIAMATKEIKSPSTIEECENGICRLTVFGENRFTKDTDGKFVNISNARTLKHTGNVIIDIKEDPDYPLVIHDYNWTWMDINFSISDTYANQNVPLIVFYKNDTVIWNGTLKLKRAQRLAQRIDLADYGLTIDDIYIKWGYNSTVVNISSVTTGLLEDLNVYDVLDGYGVYGVTFFKYNFSDVPVGVLIKNASVVFPVAYSSLSGETIRWGGNLNSSWTEATSAANLQSIYTGFTRNNSNIQNLTWGNWVAGQLTTTNVTTIINDCFQLNRKPNCTIMYWADGSDGGTWDTVNDSTQNRIQKGYSVTYRYTSFPSTESGSGVPYLVIEYGAPTTIFNNISLNDTTIDIGGAVRLNTTITSQYNLFSVISTFYNTSGNSQNYTMIPYNNQIYQSADLETSTKSFSPVSSADIQSNISCSDSDYTTMNSLDTAWTQWTIPGSGTVDVTGIYYYSHSTLATSEQVEVALYNGSGTTWSKLTPDLFINGTGATGWILKNLTTPVSITLGQTYVFGTTPNGSIAYTIERDGGSDCPSYLPNAGSWYKVTSYTLPDVAPGAGYTTSTNKYGFWGIRYGLSGNDTNSSTYQYNTTSSNFTYGLGYINVTINVSYYNSSGSDGLGNTDPDIYLELYNGTNWTNGGNFGASSAGNYTVQVTNSSILSTWTNTSNRIIRIKAIYIDVGDTINVTDVYTSFSFGNNTWYYDYDNTSTAGTYNVTYLFANDTYGFINSTTSSLYFIVSEGETPTTNCSCPTINTNFSINLSLYCTINDCNIGNGNITFTDTGNVTFNGTIIAKGIDPMPADQYGYSTQYAYVIIG